MFPLLSPFSLGGSALSHRRTPGKALGLRRPGQSVLKEAEVRIPALLDVWGFPQGLT